MAQKSCEKLIRRKNLVPKRTREITRKGEKAQKYMFASPCSSPSTIKKPSNFQELQFLFHFLLMVTGLKSVLGCGRVEVANQSSPPDKARALEMGLYVVSRREREERIKTLTAAEDDVLRRSHQIGKEYTMHSFPNYYLLLYRIPSSSSLLPLRRSFAG